MFGGRWRRKRADEVLADAAVVEEVAIRADLRRGGGNKAGDVDMKGGERRRRSGCATPPCWRE